MITALSKKKFATVAYKQEKTILLHAYIKQKNSTMTCQFKVFYPKYSKNTFSIIEN